MNFATITNITAFFGGILLGITMLVGAFLSYKHNLQRAVMLLLGGLLLLLIAIRDFWPSFLPAILP